MKRDFKKPAVFKEHDKFEDKTSLIYWDMSVSTPPPIALSSVFSEGSGYPFSYGGARIGMMSIKGIKFVMRLRASKVKNSKWVYCLDFRITTGDWFWLRDGAIVFNVNGKTNIKLTAENTSTSNTDKECREEGVMIMTAEDMKQIADAKKLEIKVSGSNTYFLIEKEVVDHIIIMFKAFYHSAVDNKAYAGYMQKQIDTLKLKAIEATVEDEDLRKQFLAGEITQSQAEKEQQKRIEAQIAKEKAEREARIKVRRKLIEEGKPEINYEKFTSMDNAKNAQMLFSGLIGIILCFAVNWWVALIAAGVIWFAFEKTQFSEEKMEEIFGAEILKKNNSNWSKLKAEYKDDVKKKT